MPSPKAGTHGKAFGLLVREFLDGRREFADFHREFIARWTRLPSGAMSDAEHRSWNEVYGWVLSTLPDDLRKDQRIGQTLTEAELRKRLRGDALPGGRG